MATEKQNIAFPDKGITLTSTRNYQLLQNREENENQ